MKSPTPKEIQDEIKALEACKAYVPRTNVFGEDNHRKLDLQIEFLKGDIDLSAWDEFDSYNEWEQSAILEAESWSEGQADESPSSGWADFKTKRGAKA